MTVDIPLIRSSGPPPPSADIVIVGSGAGGGTLAWALRDLGARVVVLERGRFLPHEPENWDATQVFLRERYKAHETWIDGSNGRAFHPGVHYLVGGNTKVYGASLPRFRQSDFTAVEHAEGVSPAWPLTYQDFEPYYDIAERLFRVHGQTGEDKTDPPRTAFPYPAVPHEPLIAEIARKLSSAGYTPAHIPLGIDLREGGRSIRCATCDGFPCLLDAKSDAEVTCLRPALDAGVQLVTGCLVQRVLTTGDGTRASGIEYELNGETRVIQTGTVVVAAGAVNSAALLLRSRSATHPDGLANSSGQLGRNYMVHNNTVMQALSHSRNPVRFQKTLHVNDFYAKGNDRHPYPLGHVQLIGKIQAAMLQGQVPPVPKSLLAQFAARSTDCWIFSEDLPDPDNRVTADDGTITVTWKPNNLAAHQELVRETRRMLRRAGYPLAISRRMGIAVNSHQAGTARFGTDPRDSVLDLACRAHDIANLFVVDSSFFPSLPVMNPALTIAANALRVADELAKDLGGTDSASVKPEA